jgi:hypothetical protein
MTVIHVNSKQPSVSNQGLSSDFISTKAKLLLIAVL